MTLNEKKLTEMVEAVVNANNLIRHLPFDNACSHYIDATTLRTALESVELTSEREVIEGFADYYYKRTDLRIPNSHIDRYLKEKGETK